MLLPYFTPHMNQVLGCFFASVQDDSLSTARAEEANSSDFDLRESA